MIRLHPTPFTPSGDPIPPLTGGGGQDEAPSPPLDVGVATGGGWVARITASRGLVGLWRADTPASLPMESPPGRHLRLFPGGWVRALDAGRVEVGLLPDVDAGPVLLHLPTPEDGGAHAAAGNSAPIEALALLPEELPPELAIPLLRPLAARMRLRRDRYGLADDSPSPATPPDPVVDAALRALDDAPAAWPPATGDGVPATPILRGMGTGSPTFLTPAEGVEVALAALLSGRRELARHLLERALHGTVDAEAEGARPPSLLPPLFLAARWLEWTGEGAPILQSRAIVAALAERLAAEAERLPPGAAWPSPPRTLELLADAVEPMGEAGWADALRGHAARLRTPRPSRKGSGFILPVLGAAPADDSELPVPDEPDLPPPAAFTEPDTPGLLPTRTLHAARLLRSWIEGVLGARAEAHFGRLTLAPRLIHPHGVPPLPALQMGDTRVRLDYRREGRAHTFRLSPDGGRVPLNLVFQPWVPGAATPEVELGGERVDVGISEESEGLRIRFQFPLEGTREVRILTDE